MNELLNLSQNVYQSGGPHHGGYHSQMTPLSTSSSHSVGLNINCPEYFCHFNIFHRLLQLHGLVLGGIWIVADIFILLGRYGHSLKYYSQIHAFFMTFSIVASYVAMALNIINANFSWNGPSTPLASHLYHVIPAIVLSIMWLMMLGSGSVIQNLKKTQKDYSKEKSYWRRLHMVMGIICWLAVKYCIYEVMPNVYHGRGFFGDPLFYLRYVFFGSVGATPFLMVILEMRRRLARKGPRPGQEEQKEPKGVVQNREELQKIIVEMIQAGASVSQLTEDFGNELLIVLYKHRIFDLTNFQHPGGVKLLKKHNYTEISRYMLGAHPDETGSEKMHSHSPAAFKFLEKHYIGDVVLNLNHRESKRGNKGTKKRKIQIAEPSFEMSLGLGVSMNDNETGSQGSGGDSSQRTNDLIPDRKTHFFVAEEETWTLYQASGDPEMSQMSQSQYYRAVSNETWTVEARRELSRHLVMIQLSNPKYKVRQAVTGTAWLGKHYYIHSTEKSQRKKPYTTVLSLSQEAIAHRNYLTQLVKITQNEIMEQEEEQGGSSLDPDTAMDISKLMNSGKTNQTQQGGVGVVQKRGIPIPPYPEFTDWITFCIKSYTEGSLSNYITSRPVGAKDLIVEGPFGSGLNLSSNFKGKCAIFGFGTGILPFLDLFDLLFKKTIYMVLEIQNRFSELDQIKPNQNYQSIFPKAEFVFYGSFSEIEDFVGYKWITLMYQLNRKYNLGVFDCKIRLRNSMELGVPSTTKRFEREFLAENVAGALDVPNRVLICATKQVMKQYSEWLELLGFPEGHVHYV